MPLTEPVFRPPAEADSVIIQVSRGCPHNSCLFCGMYKGVRYREESLEEIREQIAEASVVSPDSLRAFLADGDALQLPFDRLEEILRLVKAYFPRMARISSYANGSSIATKTDAELAKLKALGLSTLYLGLESGDDGILKLMRKGETASVMVESALRARAQGLKISVMVLLGVGGRTFSARHVEATAGALNKMRPELLSFLKMVRLPGLPLFEGFEEQSEHGAITELRQIVSLLSLEGTVVRANHASIPYPIGGRLPKDKDKLTQLLDRLLNSYMLDRNGPGPEPLAL